MKEEYSKAMEKISLSDSDRARILANVKQAYQQAEKDGVSPVPFRPRYSMKKIGTAAAAVIVLLASVTLIETREFWMGTGSDGEPAVSSSTVRAVWEDDWQELKSVEEIEKKTDCRTYTLGNISKKYKVKKVKVSNSSRHVKIVYQHEKRKDKIVFEYKEEENAPEIVGQFNEEEGVSVEKVKDMDVRMYGKEQYNSLTWEKGECTFGVRMSKACSRSKARALVSGVREGVFHRKDTKLPDGKEEGTSTEEENRHVDAVGWDGTEEAVTDSEKKHILKQIFDELGFQVTVVSPAEDVRYRKVGDYESFAFRYEGNEKLAGRRIVGYAGLEDCPAGVMDNYTEFKMVSANDAEAVLYRNDSDQCIFSFVKRSVQFTLMIGDWLDEGEEEVLADLYSVLHVSTDKGDEEEENRQAEQAEFLRDTAQRIQEAAAEANMKKLSEYIQFPLVIKELKMTVNSKTGWMQLQPADIFTSEWIEAVTAFNVKQIKSDTTRFNMGDEKNYLVCQIQDNTVLIKEIHVRPDTADGEEEEPSSGDEEESPEASAEPSVILLTE